MVTQPSKDWARPYKPYWVPDRTWGISWARWAGPRAIPTQLHCSNIQLVMLWKPSQIWRRLKTLRKKEEWGPNQEAAPTFLPVHPHKLFINIPKYTYQWRIHGDSLNTKLLSIMTRRTCLTPSSSPTPCPGWITHKAPLVFYSSKVLPEPFLTNASDECRPSLNRAATTNAVSLNPSPFHFPSFCLSRYSSLRTPLTHCIFWMTQACSSAQLQNRLQTFPGRKWPPKNHGN